MANAPALTQEQLDGFMTKFRAFRETLGPDHQRLLDAMYIAAMGKHEAEPEEVQSYWVAVARPVVVAPVAVAPVVAAPWGVAYGAVRVY